MPASKGMIGAVNEGSSSSKLAGIQSLRAVAALMVLAFHWGHVVRFQQISPSLKATLQSRDWLTYGQAGVDIFFVISGFILMYVTPRPLSSWRAIGTFLFRRMARIYPAYWALSFPGLLWRYWKNDPKMLPHDNLELLSWTFLTPYAHVPPLMVAWTLVFEIYFYVVAAVVFILSPKLRTYVAGVCFALLLAINLFHIGREHWDFIAHVYLSAFPLEFIAGVFIAYWLRTNPVQLSHKWAIALLIGAIVSIPLFYYLFDLELSATRRVMAYGPAASIIVWVIVQMDAQGKWRWFGNWAWLGDRSYSLYLVHFPVMIALFPVAVRVLPQANFFEMILMTIPVFMVMAVAVELVHRFVEKPCQDAAKRMAPHVELEKKTAAIAA